MRPAGRGTRRPPPRLLVALARRRAAAAAPAAAPARPPSPPSRLFGPAAFSRGPAAAPPPADRPAPRVRLRERSIFWARARVSRWSSGPAEPVEREMRGSPLPCPVPRFVPIRACWRPCPMPRGSVRRTRLEQKPQRRPAFLEMPDRRVRRFAIGEEPVADHRMTPLQPPPGRGVVPHHHLAQPVGDAPVRRQPGKARRDAPAPAAGSPRAPAAARADRTDRQNYFRPIQKPAPAAFPPFPEIAAPESGSRRPSGFAGSPAARPRGQKCPPRWRQNRAATG